MIRNVYILKDVMTPTDSGKPTVGSQVAEMLVVLSSTWKTVMHIQTVNKPQRREIGSSIKKEKERNRPFTAFLERKTRFWKTIPG